MVDQLDGTFGSGPARVNVKGLNRTLRALQTAGADTDDMKDLMHSIGMIVVRQAQSNVSSATGNLRDTIRAGRGKTKAVVRAGGARAKYAGVNHYGNPHTGLAGNPFLVNALRTKRSDVLERLSQGLGEILKKNNLK